MATVWVDFKGICTHLTKLHNHSNAPRFKLFTGEMEIEHRVFIPNSELINARIDPDRCVVPHVPKIRFVKSGGEPDERLLQNVAISFEGVVPASNYEELERLPHMWDLNGGTGLLLRESVLKGWTHYASAYVDFNGGAEFSVDDQKNASAKMTFDKTPTLVMRQCNSDKDVTKLELEAGSLIEISNLPSGTVCSPSDYLLNYFATTLDISQRAPVWPIPRTDCIPIANDVYCTSTGYP